MNIIYQICVISYVCQHRILWKKNNVNNRHTEIKNHKYNDKRYGVDVTETTLKPRWKCQPQNIHWSLMYGKKVLIPQDRLQLAPKHHFTQIRHKSCNDIHKNTSKLTKSENETRYTVVSNSWLDTGRKFAAGLKYLAWSQLSPSKSDHCKKNGKINN